jgi:hypothetical protein
MESVLKGKPPSKSRVKLFEIISIKHT